jgi:DNA invertase Pin-like site-specific DNA recombinase
MPIAYSYRRFSSEAQDGNDSIRRQTAAAQRFIEENPQHQLVLDSTLSLIDAGVSAFKGKNLKHGALGIFMDAVKEEMIPRGSWLLIESLDRLSRQAVNLAASNLLSLVNNGVIVVTLHNNVIYQEEDFEDGSIGLVNLLGALIAMQGHHQEQVTKGKRVAEAWKANYSKIAATGGRHVVTRTVPFWLSVSSDRTSFIVLNDKVQIVKEIFERNANGEGKTKIANDLTSRGIPTAKGRSSTWHPSAVEKILLSDAPIGILKNNKGETYENYYPTIINHELYQTVRALRHQSSALGNSAIAHPLTGLVMHSCGKTMRRVNKGKKGGATKLWCPNCFTGMPYAEALSLVSQAIFNAQYSPAPSVHGEELLGLTEVNDELNVQAEAAYLHWRKVKTIEARTQWERLLQESNELKSQLSKLKGVNTEVLIAMEDQRIAKAANKGDILSCLRSITVSINFNEDYSTLALNTISGKTIRESREDSREPYI